MPIRTVRVLDEKLRLHEAAALEKVEAACTTIGRRFGSPDLFTPLREDPRRLRLFDLAASDVTDLLRDLLRAASYETTISLQRDIRAVASHTGKRDLLQTSLGADGHRNLILAEWLSLVRDGVIFLFGRVTAEIDRQWLLHLLYDKDKEGKRRRELWTRRLHHPTPAGLLGRSGIGLLQTLPGQLSNLAVNHLYGYVNDARNDAMALVDEQIR